MTGDHWRFPNCRGNWNNTSNAGPAYANGNRNGRSNTNRNIGFALDSYGSLMLSVCSTYHDHQEPL